METKNKCVLQYHRWLLWQRYGKIVWSLALFMVARDFFIFTNCAPFGKALRLTLMVICAIKLNRSIK